MEKKHISYLSLGSNLEDKKLHLKSAVDAINENFGNISKVSSIYKTPAQGFEGKDFYNICIELKTNLTPETLLDKLQNLEETLGRTKTKQNEYENRVIDIDIVLFDDLILNTPKLTIPHPRALNRDFVLFPLLEIAPKIEFPDIKKSLSMLVEKFNTPQILNKKL